jgi:hypothetical protein
VAAAVKAAAGAAVSAQAEEDAAGPVPPIPGAVDEEVPGAAAPEASGRPVARIVLTATYDGG